MKSHQTLVLLIFGVSLAACKKESPVQSMSSASSQQNATTATCKTCPDINASNFVKRLSNPYFPLVPGTSFHFVNSIIENKKTTFEHVDVTITPDTKVIIGVTCAVV